MRGIAALMIFLYGVPLPWYFMLWLQGKPTGWLLLWGAMACAVMSLWWLRMPSGEER